MVCSYSFELADFDIINVADNVAAIRVVDRRYVEIEYMDGRRVRYLYNRSVSER